MILSRTGSLTALLFLGSDMIATNCAMKVKNYAEMCLKKRTKIANCGIYYGIHFTFLWLRYRLRFMKVYEHHYIKQPLHWCYVLKWGSVIMQQTITRHVYILFWIPKFLFQSLSDRRSTWCLLWVYLMYIPKICTWFPLCRVLRSFTGRIHINY